MRNLFVVYGDVLSDKLLYLADVIAMPAYGGSMKPHDELTERFFELSGRQKLERAIAEKYGNEPMQHGEVRKIIGGELIEATLFVNSADTPLWSIEKEPEIEKRIIVGYHNAVTVAGVLVACSALYAQKPETILNRMPTQADVDCDVPDPADVDVLRSARDAGDGEAQEGLHQAGLHGEEGRD